MTVRRAFLGRQFLGRMALTLVLAASFATPFVMTLACTKAETARDQPAHRIVIQINSEDPVAMRHAITTSLNASRYFGDRHDPIAIEIVAYGPGVHMFRADTSPVKDLLAFLRGKNPNVAFSACGNTRTIMERNEGRPLTFVEGTRVVPYGIVRLVELQEAGWSYLRP